MLKRIIILVLIALVSGCAGIRFCDEHGRPIGCRYWDPGTKNGGAVRS